MGAVACGQRSGANKLPPRAATRARVAAMVPSVTLSLRPGNSVRTSPTTNGRNGCSVNASSPVAAACSTSASSAPGTANGITLMVATMSRGATTLKSGRVATVSASLTRFTRSILPAFTRKSPATSACRFTRPVPARPAVRPGLWSTSATRAALSFSPTSPGSSRAAITSTRPARRNAAMASASSTTPFLTTRSPSRCVCATMAPIASSSPTAPNLMRRLARAPGSQVPRCDAPPRTRR